MYIEFRHGPKDGEKKFLPLGKACDTIIVVIDKVDFLYRKTPRYTQEGHIVYQCVSLLGIAA